MDNVQTVLTIGHSTRTFEELAGLLAAHGVAALADVRTFPRSRRHPWFNGDTLAATLPAQGIAYLRLPALGGRRRPRPDSANGGWRNPSFRAFADHLATEEFDDGLAALLGLAAAYRTCIMCSEAVPWRCHRSLIADALLVRGVAVEHIIGPGSARRHTLTPFARVDAGRLSYPAAGLDDAAGSVDPSV